MKGKNTSVITSHVQKCFGYNESIKSHYIVVYFTGEKVHFDQTWEDYKKTVLDVTYPEKYPLDKTKGMLLLNSQFTAVENLKIGKTVHKTIELFHVMIDLS